MGYWDEIEEIAERAWGAVMIDSGAATPPDIEELSVREAYWRGKYEESRQTREMLVEMFRSQAFHLGSERLTRGMIGPGSSVYYGTDPEVLGAGIGVTGVVFGIAAFAVVSATAGAAGLAVGLGGLAIAGVSLLRRKSKSPF